MEYEQLKAALKDAKNSDIVAALLDVKATGDLQAIVDEIMQSAGLEFEGEPE